MFSKTILVQGYAYRTMIIGILHAQLYKMVRILILLITVTTFCHHSRVKAWGLNMAGGMKLFINGDIYSFLTSQCSGGIFFKNPVKIDTLCIHGYFLRRQNACKKNGSDIVSGSNYVCLKGDDLPKQAFIPLTNPNAPLDHTITFYDEDDTLSNFRRFTYLKGMEHAYKETDNRNNAVGVIVTNPRKVPKISIEHLCYQGLEQSRGVALWANMTPGLQGQGGFFSRNCKTHNATFPWVGTDEYSFVDGYSSPKPFLREILAVPSSAVGHNKHFLSRDRSQFEIWNGLAYCLQEKVRLTDSNKIELEGIHPSIESLSEYCSESAEWETAKLRRGHKKIQRSRRQPMDDTSLIQSNNSQMLADPKEELCPPYCFEDPDIAVHEVPGKKRHVSACIKPNAPHGVPPSAVAQPPDSDEDEAIKPVEPEDPMIPLPGKAFVDDNQETATRLPLRSAAPRDIGLKLCRSLNTWLSPQKPARPLRIPSPPNQPVEPNTQSLATAQNQSNPAPLSAPLKNPGDASINLCRSLNTWLSPQRIARATQRPSPQSQSGVPEKQPFAAAQNKLNPDPLSAPLKNPGDASIKLCRSLNTWLSPQRIARATQRPPSQSQSGGLEKQPLDAVQSQPNPARDMTINLCRSLNAWLSPPKVVPPIQPPATKPPGCHKPTIGTTTRRATSTTTSATSTEPPECETEPTGTSAAEPPGGRTTQRPNRPHTTAESGEKGEGTTQRPSRPRITQTGEGGGVTTHKPSRPRTTTQSGGGGGVTTHKPSNPRTTTESDGGGGGGSGGGGVGVRKNKFIPGLLRCVRLCTFVTPVVPRTRFVDYPNYDYMWY